MNLYQDFIVEGDGLLYILESKNIRRPVLRVQNRFQGLPPGPPCGNQGRGSIEPHDPLGAVRKAGSLG